MNKLYVIILNWNGFNDTADCINSLKYQKYINFEIIVVDNGSQDDSVINIKTHFPNITIIENQKNLGYAGGMNVGIQHAIKNNVEKVLLLNNDTITDPNMINELVNSSLKEINVVGPAIFYADAPATIWSIGGKINPILLEMRKPHGDTVSLPKMPLNQDFLTGCALLIHTKIFKDIGMFDESYFPGYYEDLDFCLRVRKKGYAILVIPSAKLWHKVSQTSGGKTSPKIQFLMGRNSAIYFRKNMKVWNIPFILIYRLLSAIKKTFYFLFKGETQNITAMWSGLIIGWTGLFRKNQKKYIAFYQENS